MTTAATGVDEGLIGGAAVRSGATERHRGVRSDDPADQQRERGGISRREAEVLRGNNARLQSQRQRGEDRIDELVRQIEALNYAIAHDLRQPLRAVDGFARLLSEDLESLLDDATRGYFERICAAVVRMDGMIDALLSMSRLSIAPMTSERADLAAMAHEIVGDLRARHPQRSVDVQVAEDLHVTGDPRMLHTLLQILFDNAWKFSVFKDQAEICFGVRRGSSIGTVYYVSDNGIGLDKAWRGNLFRAFHRLHDIREFEGHGIGLVLASRIVQRHGGRIWAEGSLGNGATFFFTLGGPDLWGMTDDDEGRDQGR